MKTKETRGITTRTRGIATSTRKRTKRKDG